MVFRHFYGGLLDLGRHGVEGVRPGGRQVVFQAGFVQLGHVRLQDFFRRQAGKQPDEDGNEALMRLMKAVLKKLLQSARKQALF